MKNIDKGLTVPKWVLINWPKIPQMPQNLSTQIVCPSPKDWDFGEKRLHWAYVVGCVNKDLGLFLSKSWRIEKCDDKVCNYNSNVSRTLIKKPQILICTA